LKISFKFFKNQFIERIFQESPSQKPARPLRVDLKTKFMVLLPKSHKLKSDSNQYTADRKMGKKPPKKKGPVEEKSWTTPQILCLILSAGYLCTDFIPHFEKYADILYPQWFYLSVLTLVCFAFIFLYRDQFQPILSMLTKNIVVRLFFLFIIISAISLIQATNLPEGVIDLGRIILTLFIFLFLSAFIYLLRDRFHILAKLIVLILLYQSAEGLFDFFDKAGGFDLKTIFSSVAADFANKNIMAVTLLIKGDRSYIYTECEICICWFCINFAHLYNQPNYFFF